MSDKHLLEVLSHQFQCDHSVQQLEQLPPQQKRYGGVIVNRMVKFELVDEFLVQLKEFHMHMVHGL